MNILFSLDNYDHGSGGAEMSAQAISRELVTRGHTVTILQRGDTETSYDDGPVSVHTRTLPQPRFFRDRDRDTLRWNQHWHDKLNKFVHEHPTDLVLTQNRLLYSTVDVALHANLPVAVFVRAYSMFCPNQFATRDALTECDMECSDCLSWKQRLKRGVMRRNMDRYVDGLQAAPVVLANSRYMQRVILRFLERDSEICYPSVDASRFDGDATGDSVLFCKPQHVKGLPIFLEVAKAMPKTRFLVAGKLRGRAEKELAKLKNVECLGWVSDMRKAYARARLILGPSIWPEPFGRVFVEAAAHGIPCVASDRGGIPEAVGPGGILIDDIFDTSRWIDAIRQFDNPKVQKFYSAHAKAHAAQFSAEASVRQMIHSIYEHLSIEL